MSPYHPELLATPVPRYTSFPSAAQFGPDVGPAEMERALRDASGDISIYVHIPFCDKICWYCGCSTGAANRPERLTNYLDALHREIILVGGLLGKRARARRIAFGGGSPNAISPTDLVRLVIALTQYLPLVDPVWSIELDPRNLPQDWERALSSIGFSRASLGVQTFAPHLQAAIGRIQPDADIVRATALLRDAGVTSLNFDLMYGLPGQTLADLELTLGRAIELGADRIALFGYAHVPHIVPRQRRIDATLLPGMADRFAMAALGSELLTAAGYVAVGFDHFALPHDPLAQAAKTRRLRRNFQGFTDDKASTLIGLGASAISSFPALTVQNEKNIGRYGQIVAQGGLPAAVGLVRSSEDQRTGRLIEMLLCQGEARLGPDLAASMHTALEPFVARGLAQLTRDRLRIRPAGLPYARSIAALFDPYLAHAARSFSPAV
ncbi:MAG: radical SAM protein [Pseudomonadota bacterium]|nr:radical SAM protein [Pseudomonadota bacterium]